jgi:ribonucleoside-diphosphate reductase alpha chain
MEYNVYPVRKVIKRDGRVVDFDENRIREAVRKAMVHVNMYDEVTLKQVVDYILKIIAEKFGSERIPHVEEIQDIVELTLVKFDLYEVAKAYIIYRKEREKIREEKKRILEKSYVDEVDKVFSVNALRLMASRYLLRDEKGKLVEGPKEMFKRVAALIVIPDILYDPQVYDISGSQQPHPWEDFDIDAWSGKLGLGRLPNGEFDFKWNRWHLERMKNLYDELNSNGHMRVPWAVFLKMLIDGFFEKYHSNCLQYYKLMVDKKFMPNSPTLFNAGTRLGQLSACFVLDIDDDIESIMNAAKDAAIIFKSGGGVGINYSKLRPEGDLVFSTFGVASGPVSFMRIIDTVTDVVKQGGKRRGANMGILEIWHPDIETFIHSKEKENFLENFNISVLITPEFWKYYEEKKPFPLRNPRDGTVWRTVDPERLFREIAEAAWRTADPGVLFLDNINKHNIFKRFLGDIRSTNPCITGDMRIPTSIGLVKLSELYSLYHSGKDVEVLSDNRALQYNIITIPHGILSREYCAPGTSLRKAVKVVKTGIKPVYQVITEHGYVLKATEDHMILTRRGWVPLRELKIGDELMIQSGEGGFGKIGSEGLGRILGWFVGDSSISGNRVTLWFYCKDGKIALDLARDIHNIFQLKVNVKRAEDGDALFITSRKLYRWLTELGILNRLRVPEIVFKGTREMQKGFLQALFTANGKVDTGNRGCSIRLTSISIDLLRDIQLLLLNFGIVSKIHENRSEAQLRILSNRRGRRKLYKHQAYHELSIDKQNVNLFAEKIGFLDKGKQRKLIYWIKKKRNSDVEKYITRVKKVEYVGLEEVYDITEPITNSFIANGVSVHNCGEQPLYTYESCNLGSINLYAFVRKVRGKYDVDWDSLREAVKWSIKFLDNVIDVNKYPLEQIEYKTKRSRRVGLGVMGMADMLFALGIPYNSEEGFQMMSKIMEFIAFHAYKTSIELAGERGVFPLYDQSDYPKGVFPIEGFNHPEWWTLPWRELAGELKKKGIRNSHVTTVAPTGSISMLLDVSSGLEPQFALVYEKRVTVGTFFYTDIEFEKQLKERGLLNESILKKVAENGGSVQGLEEIPEDIRKVFLVAYDIPWWDHIRAQYEIQKWVDASVSKTINMPAWVTVEDVMKAYIFAYKLGLKGITIYRDTSKAAQVLVTPSQRLSKYIALTPNKTLELMKQLGIEPPRIHNESKEKSSEVSKPGVKLIITEIGGAEVAVEEEKKSMLKPSTRRVEKCPVCESINLIYQEGCLKCLDCGWANCVIA